MLAKAINISSINFRRERLHGKFSKIQWDEGEDRARLNQEIISQTWAMVPVVQHSMEAKTQYLNHRLASVSGTGEGIELG